MGRFKCDRCDEYGDSKGGDVIDDPYNDQEMIHESCMTESEIDEKNRSDYFGREYD